MLCPSVAAGQLAVFPRCSLLAYQSRNARRSRLEKIAHFEPNDVTIIGETVH